MKLHARAAQALRTTAMAGASTGPASAGPSGPQLLQMAAVAALAAEGAAPGGAGGAPGSARSGRGLASPAKKSRTAADAAGGGGGDVCMPDAPPTARSRDPGLVRPSRRLRPGPGCWGRCWERGRHASRRRAPSRPAWSWRVLADHVPYREERSRVSGPRRWTPSPKSGLLPAGLAIRRRATASCSCTRGFTEKCSRMLCFSPGSCACERTRSTLQAQKRAGLPGAQFKPFNWQTQPEWPPADAGGATPFALRRGKAGAQEDSIMLVRPLPTCAAARGP